MERNDIDKSERDVLRRSATGGEHQITAIPMLLAQLDLRGHTFTSDAMMTTGKKREKERRYYLSSKEESAAYFQKAIRQHWSIENQCHRVLDTCFREDRNQTRKANAAKNLGAVRRIVLNILKKTPASKAASPQNAVANS